MESWDLPRNTSPMGLLLHQQQLYILDQRNPTLLIYTLTGQLLPTPDTLHTLPRAIDIEAKNGFLYVMDKSYLIVLNLKREKISSFALPSWGGYGLKVDRTLLYLTLSLESQIFVYSLQGTLMNTFGIQESGNKEGQLNEPKGITVDTRDLYICDSNNHRIQVLKKDNGMYQRQWGKEGIEEGQLYYPLSIYLSNSSNTIVYVGDWMSVQLFTTEGVCLQRIGEIKRYGGNTFSEVYGICVGRESRESSGSRLYVCDGNCRIQVFGNSLNSTRDLNE